jgi:hypothetical protein
VRIKFGLTVSIIVILAYSAWGDDIYSLIKNGEIEEARDQLSRMSTAQQRDGNYLFYLSLIEPNGKKAIELMTASLGAGVSSIYRDEINLRLSQYYLLNRDYGQAGPIITDYLALFESGKYRPEFFKYSVVLDEKEKRYESAIRQIDRYLLQYTSPEDEQLGLVSKARLMVAFDKMIAARDVLKKLSREKSGIGVPMALYMLTLDAAARKSTDDAVFYFNLLKEAYPAAVGLDALLDRMSGLETHAQREKTADERTGTFYSIQVGVFSTAENAKKLAREFEKYGHKVEIKFKDISDRTYHVVYVGRFDSYESAASFEKTLEADQNDVYQVIAR